MSKWPVAEILVESMNTITVVIFPLNMFVQAAFAGINHLYEC